VIEPRPHRRASDGPVQARFWLTLRTIEAVFQKSGLIICLIIATFSVAIAAYAVWGIQNEADVRRSQTCESFESAYAEQIRRLENTYVFLTLPGIKERSPDLYALALRELTALETAARKDSDPFGPRVPDYCDDEGVGLPEPDPKVPRRPADLRIP
jgi:hypothetical protein